MTQIEIAEGMLQVEILGWDKLWAFKSRLDIPVGNIRGVRQREDPPKFGFRGIRCPGTFLPGVIVAGSYYQGGKWSFWDVHNSKNVVEIELQNERYSTLVLEVEEPESTSRMIRQAITSAPGRSRE